MRNGPPDALGVTDPADLLHREDVLVDDGSAVIPHEHHAQLYNGIEGMVVVGARDEAGRLLLQVSREELFAALPHATVAPGENWTQRARDAVAETAGIVVRVDGVRRVKRRRYRRPDDETATEGYQVFVDATPVGEQTPAPPAEVVAEWTVGWHDEVPVPTTDENEETVADIRAFLD
jgi:hypothetical protein